MRLIPIPLMAGGAAGVALAVALVTGGPVAVAATPPRADLSRFVCQKALDPPNRSVSIQAVMRPLAATRRLAVRFDLLERTPDSAAATVVHAQGLGVWITPTDPTLGQRPGDVWRVNKSVLNLDAPARYAFRVTYRWTGLHGELLGTAIKYSRTCRQRELRPDLLVQSITVSAISGHLQNDLYTAVIANQGLTPAGPFEVLFAPGDASVPITRTVQLLRPSASKRIEFVGPACDADSPPTVTVDATDEVNDFNRANNVMTAVCPAVSTTGTASVVPRGKGTSRDAALD
jgi:hypothetical protein